MKVIFVLFDSLNRRSLECYGGRRCRRRTSCGWRAAASRSTTTTSAACRACPRGATCTPGGSRSCIAPGGRSSRSTIRSPRSCTSAGVYSHLVSDHYHYWEDGGATYHNRYDTFEFVRGQERDPWKAMVEPPWERFREKYHRVQFSDQRRHKFAQYMINREFIREYADFPSVRCFDAGLEFLDRNRDGQRLAAARRDVRSARAVLRARPVPRRLSDRLPRADPRLAAVRARDRSARGMRGAARELLRDRRAVRPRARPPAGRHGRAAHVGRHGADRDHRPWLPARRARLVGEDRHALLQRGRAHSAVLPPPGDWRVAPARAAAR